MYSYAKKVLSLNLINEKTTSTLIVTNLNLDYQ